MTFISFIFYLLVYIVSIFAFQVRIQASSYLLDDLANSKIVTRVLCAEPEPALWAPDTDISVRLLNWHKNYRSVLVKLNHPEQLAKLADLEAQLTEVVANERSVTKFLEQNLYIW